MICNVECRKIFNSMILPFKWLMGSQLATETLKTGWDSRISSQEPWIHWRTFAAFIHYQLNALSGQFHVDKRLNILLPAPLSLVAKSFCDLSLITLKEVHQFYEVSNKKRILVAPCVKLFYRLNSKQLSLLQLLLETSGSFP